MASKLTGRRVSAAIIAAVAALFVGFGYWPAFAGAIQVLHVEGAEDPDETGAIDVINASAARQGSVSVADNVFAVKARGEGENGEAAVTVGGNVVNTSLIDGKQGMYGLIAYGFHGGKATVDVGGNVNANQEGTPEVPGGIDGIFNKASSGTTTINVMGDVSASGRGDATGINMSGDGAEVLASVKVGGSVTASSSNTGEERFDAFGINVEATDGAQTELEVAGGVSALSEDSQYANGCGVYAFAGANADYDGALAASSVVLHGNVDATGTEMAAGAKVAAAAGARSDVTVDGDVDGSSAGTGVGAWVESEGNGTAGLAVNGTVRGTDVGLMFDGSGTTSYDIAVWKIEVGEGGSLFQRGDYASGVPEDAFKQVNYIVKVNQPDEGGTVTAVGPQGSPLAKSHGYEVARAGEKVHLNVALEPGYRLAAACNGVGEDSVPLSRDEDGYYVTVPEGGGISLSATIVKDESAAGMSIADGMAQPVFTYSDVHGEGYTNANSELYRFVVYVETDYDTDCDGKCDLVKTYVQVPRAAVEGKYRAPVLFRADPYSAGMRSRDGSFEFASPSLDDAALMGRPAHRVPTRAITSENLALNPSMTKKSDWNYQIGQVDYPGGITSLDYYLVRGFAVVQAAGLGTYGSEGIECCGTVMERDAFVNVVEWLHGAQGRAAYADAEGTIEVKAGDWSSGHVGMTGLSYPGTMCYEVATSGVEGLDTIVPVAGPSSWYDTHNRQGICTDATTSYNYTTVLADTCASRFLAEDDAGITPDGRVLSLYQRYRTFMRDSQARLQGDYGPYWAARDWYTGQTGIRASALIVTGLNDTNVTTKHFDLMRSALLASGCEVKTLLHQNEHVIPADDNDYSDIEIGGHTYLEWLNLWFTRALLDVDNEAAELPAFTVQSNVDGSFYESDRWDSDDVVTLYPDEGGETTVKAEGATMGSDLSEDSYTGKASDNAALWTLSAVEPFTIAGRIPVHVRAKVNDAAEGDIPMCAALVDVADEPYPAFLVNGGAGHEIVEKGEGNSRSYDTVRWTQGETTKKMVSTGYIDLRNPEAGYEPATATKRTEPIQADTYYDYTIWLDPTYYTVQAGHRLELYILPFLGYNTYPDSETRDYMLSRAGLDASALMNLRTDYAFTISNAESFATLPLREDVGYALVRGDGGRWAKGASESLAFTWKRTINDAETFRHFTGVAVDGVAIDASAYQAESGSVVMSLYPAYLETLGAGDHEVQALFDDGVGPQAAFTVTERPADSATSTPDASAGTPTKAAGTTTSTAKTDDTAPVVPAAALAAVALVLALTARAARRGWRALSRR